MKKIGVLGAAYGPPTLGHACLIEQSLEEFDEIWLIPSFSHGFGKEMFPYEFRCKLTEQFAQDLNDPRIKAHPIEHCTPAAQQGKPVYTWDLLYHLDSCLQFQESDDQLGFIIGPDNAENWHKFHRSAEIEKFWKVYIGRESREIRSTMVRNAIANGESISEFLTPGVEKLMKTAPPEVLDLIRRQAAQNKKK